jgi:hypothetical protein
VSLYFPNALIYDVLYFLFLLTYHIPYHSVIVCKSLKF